MMGVGSDVSSATAAETSLGGVAVVDADSKTEPIGVGEAGSKRSAVEVEQKVMVDSVCDSGTDTAVCGSGEPAGSEVKLQQSQTDINDKTEKSRLYTKNVKLDPSATGPAASLVKDSGKAGTPPRQDVKVTKDQPSNAETVVLRDKKTQSEPSTAAKKENEASTIQRVRTDFVIYYQI